jgi:hypothetical protein
MKKRLVLPAAVAALALCGALPSASAAPVSTTSVQSSAAACETITAHLGNVKIRKKPKANSTAVALWLKNTKGCWHRGLTGGKYNKCGRNWDGWGYVTWRGYKGYVPNACVKPA